MSVYQATRVVDSLTVVASIAGFVLGLLNGDAAIVLWAFVAAAGHARLARKASGAP